MYKTRQGALEFVQAKFSVDVMISSAALLSVFALAGTAVAVPSRTGTAKRATCTVNSVSSASDLSDCSDVVIAAFTVPGGSRHFRLFLECHFRRLICAEPFSGTVTIEAASGATVTMTGKLFNVVYN